MKSLGGFYMSQKLILNLFPKEGLFVKAFAKHKHH